MLMGEYKYTIDEKGRLNLPTRFREQMGSSLVVTRWLDQCLVLFSQQRWESICQQITAQGMVKTRDMQRFLFAMATEVVPDRQGRILISGPLRQHAGLDKDVTIIGVGTHAELWNSQAWQDKQSTFGSQELEAALEELSL